MILPAHLSAQKTFSFWQVSLLFLLLIGWFLWLLNVGVEAAMAFAFFCTLLKLALCIYGICLVTLSITGGGREVHVARSDLATLDRKTLPLYTILIPLYKEAELLPRLTSRLTALDYPIDKLEVILLLEADDAKTIVAVEKVPLPPHFHVLIVPAGYPKTKPRACNMGLVHARGQFLVIYDAEDQPDPDQLMKALIAFQRSNEQVICVQSRLNFYNPRQNLLTRLFTLEYSHWFDLILPALSAIDAPIPLGGTSNHFRTSALKAIGGWDAFNVAEDCDLGIRLFTAGYRAIIVNSTTWEEANSQLGNWIRQRSRWIKGYLQTYIVHMRNPSALFRNLGWRNFLGFQLIVGGTPLVLFLAPILWLLMLASRTTQLEAFEQIVAWRLPEYIHSFELISLVFSIFTCFYFGLCGALVRGNYDLAKYVLLTPLYGALQSVAAWKGCFQLLTKPHHWEKTTHGLFPLTLVRQATSCQWSNFRQRQ